jgi:hypothetical protein
MLIVFILFLLFLLVIQNRETGDDWMDFYSDQTASTRMPEDSIDASDVFALPRALPPVTPPTHTQPQNRHSIPELIEPTTPISIPSPMSVSSGLCPQPFRPVAAPEYHTIASSPLTSPHYTPTRMSTPLPVLSPYSMTLSSLALEVNAKSDQLSPHRTAIRSINYSITQPNWVNHDCSFYAIGFFDYFFFRFSFLILQLSVLDCSTQRCTSVTQGGLLLGH